MSINKKFKSSSKLVNEGAWYSVCDNADGTKCRVRLRRIGPANKLWNVKLREYSEGIDTDNLSPEEDAALMATVFAAACVVEWEHLKLEDEQPEMPFTLDNAINLLSNPDYADLLNDWRGKSGAAGNYRADKEAEAGN